MTGVAIDWVTSAHAGSIKVVYKAVQSSLITDTDASASIGVTTYFRTLNFSSSYLSLQYLRSYNRL